MGLYLKPKGKLLAWITKVHTALYRRTAGALGARLPGMRVLLLTSVGRKTGQRRTAPLPYFREEGKLIVVASNAAQPRHPAWYHNLVDEPRVELQLRREIFAAEARVLQGEERERIWARIVLREPRYAHYQELCQRQIPLVALERADV